MMARTNSAITNFYTEVCLHSNKSADVIDEVREALMSHKVVKLVPYWHLENPRTFYDELSEALGTTMDIAEDYSTGGAQTGERWMEIRYDESIPDLDAYRHSKNAQPLHTDESYISDPADVMLFYSVNRAPSGGETLFVDARQLVELLETTQPDLLEQLTSTIVRHQKADNSRTRKIIDISADGELTLNYNFYCIDPNESEEVLALNRAFFQFVEQYVKGSYIEQSVMLAPTEGVLWWDHLVLHGRKSFKAEKTNDRYIWKTGIRI